MANDIIVKISQAATPGRAAFGIPMIASVVETEDSVVNYVTYASLSEMEKDGKFTTTKNPDIYNAAQLIWSQDMKPRRIAVHTCLNKLELTGSWMDEDWRQLIAIDLGKDQTKEKIAEAIEAREDKFYFTSLAVKDEGITDDSTFTEKWKEAIKPFAKFNRTMVLYYPDTWSTTAGEPSEDAEPMGQEKTLFTSGTKKGSDLISADTRILDDGSVVGTLKNVTGFTEFSSATEQQSGHFFPFTLDENKINTVDAEGKKMTFKKNGQERKKDINFDKDIIFKTEKDDVWEVIVGEKSVLTLNFAHAKFE